MAEEMVGNDNSNGEEKTAAVTVEDTKSHYRKKTKKVLDATVNPCIKEQQLSLNCMSELYADREQCSTFFHNYKNCVQFWARVKKHRHQKGIVPELPPVDQREQIKDDYYKKWANHPDSQGLEH